MAKKSVLDDNADLYQRRVEKSEKEKLKDMNRAEKLDYFKTYYLKKTIAGIFLVCFVGYFLWSVLGPKVETVLDVAVIDSSLNDKTCETLKKDMTSYLKLDKKKSDVLIDNSFILNSSSQLAMSNQQKLVTYLMAKEIDVVIAPKDEFDQFAKSGYFSKLSDALPTELISSLKDRFYETTTDDDKTKSAYGISLEGMSLLDSDDQLVKDPMLGIVVNSEYPDNAVSLVQYLYDHYMK